jgi:hypothetical protein
VVKVAFGLLTVFVLVAVLHGLLAGVLAETWLRLVAQVPLAVLAIGMLPWATDQVAGLIDVICAAVAPSDQLLVGVGEGLASLPRTRLGLPALVLSLVGFLAVAVIYLELVVRNALVVATVALAPLSFAAMAWPAARPAARKVVELLAAVLVSKLATMVVLAVGVDLFARRDPVSSPSGFGQLVAALAVLVIAAGAPWITWRLLPVAEAALIGIGVARLPVRTATQVGQSAVTRQMTGRAASRPSGTTGAATGAGSSGGGGTRAGGWPAPSGAAPDPGPGPVRDEPVPRPRRRRR